MNRDMIDKIRRHAEEGPIPETTFASDINFLPGYFDKSCKPMLKTLARLQKTWQISVLDDGSNVNVGFGKEAVVRVPKEYIAEFASKAFFGWSEQDGLYPNMLIELSDDLCEAVTPAVLIDELVLKIGDALLHLLHKDSLLDAYNDLLGFKKEFDRNYTAQPIKDVLLRVDTEQVFNRDLELLKAKLKQTYSGDQGSLEMILEAIREKQPLHSFDVFQHTKFLYGFTAQVRLGAPAVTYIWTVDMNYAVSEKLIVAGESADAILSGLSKLTYVKVTDNMVYPVGPVFRGEIWRDLHGLAGTPKPVGEAVENWQWSVSFKKGEQNLKWIDTHTQDEKKATQIAKDRGAALLSQGYREYGWSKVSDGRTVGEANTTGTRPKEGETRVIKVAVHNGYPEITWTDSLNFPRRFTQMFRKTKTGFATSAGLRGYNASVEEKRPAIVAVLSKLAWAEGRDCLKSAKWLKEAAEEQAPMPGAVVIEKNADGTATIIGAFDWEEVLNPTTGEKERVRRPVKEGADNFGSTIRPLSFRNGAQAFKQGGRWFFRGQEGQPWAPVKSESTLITQLEQHPDYVKSLEENKGEPGVDMPLPVFHVRVPYRGKFYDRWVEFRNDQLLPQDEGWLLRRAITSILKDRQVQQRDWGLLLAAITRDGKWSIKRESERVFDSPVTRQVVEFIPLETGKKKKGTKHVNGS